MPRIAWASRAVNDFVEIVEYIAAEAAETARRVGFRIIKAAEQIRLSVRLGARIPEFDLEAYREIISGRYRIIHRIIDEENCRIVAVYHGARDLTTGLSLDELEKRAFIDAELDLPGDLE